MSHARQQIREAVATALTTDLAGTATVTEGRTWIQQQPELPHVSVYTVTEESDQDQTSFDALYRELALVCEITVKGVDGNAASDALDVLAESIEQSLGTRRQVIGIQDLYPESWDVTLTSDGDQVNGAASLTYSCQYRTVIGQPDLIV